MSGWGEDEEESKDGEGEVCVTERERVRMRVGLTCRMCGGGVACVYLQLERRLVLGVRVEAKVSDSEAR